MRMVLLSALCLVGLAVPATAAGAPPPGPLRWEPCPVAGSAEPQECATLRVPLDYRKPHGQEIDVRVSRIPAKRPDARHGVLLLIPGGPGSSGLNRPSTLDLPAELRERFDVVGFDPRGVGKSTPISCAMSPEDNGRTMPWPAPDGGIDANVAQGKRIAETCRRNGGEVLPHINTKNEVRDLDRLRQALGERKLSYWGLSYGTYVGAVYATMFPQHTDRVVLDSTGDPRTVARGWLANYQIGVEDRFPDFARWAADPANALRLADDPAAIRPLFLDLAARLDHKPLPGLTGNGLREALLRNLYTDKGFEPLAKLMIAARDGSPVPTQPQPPEDVLQNTSAMAVSTVCNDVEWPGSVKAHERAVAESRERFPLTGGMPVNITPCSFWPFEPVKPVRITDDGPSNVLLVQNTRDPSTPLAGAREMRRALGDRARMVTVDSGGHGAYRANGNACGDDTVTQYLLTGQLQKSDSFCP
ncbi:alpha/beta hydrolase [Amycolatopsis magusensis]|uniref:alpha/beta hydrolase n=1 Tax=Amycolatopsis magusensis TaxID=882444 RepID=UPI00379389F7